MAIGSGATDSSALDDFDREFLTASAGALIRLSSEHDVSLPDWTITRDDIEKQELIGTGFFSKVYKGLCHERTVAIKELDADRTTHKLFVNEAEICMHLRHPNVIALLGASSATSNPPWFLITPFYRNGNLVHYLKGLEEDAPVDSVKMMLEIAQGMEYLHKEKVVHGDLKASNILVDDELRCIVADFGQSELKAEFTRLTAVSPPESHGTMMWLAPEVLRGFATELTREVDIYAFGILCAEVLNKGAPPWGPSVTSIALVRDLVCDQHQRPRLPGPYSESSNHPVSKIIRAAWADSRRLRPPFVRIVQELEAARDMPLSEESVTQEIEKGQPKPLGVYFQAKAQLRRDDPTLARSVAPFADIRHAESESLHIHEDAQQGKLTRDALTRYLRHNPDILSEQNPATGRAPLATAAVAGFADEVEQLLKMGAKADALSRDGETALLLVTRPKASRNRPRIVQLLLSKMPADSIDATTAENGNNTPLMFTVLNSDVESMRLLVKAGASLKAINDMGLTAKDMSTDKAILLALKPEKQATNWLFGLYPKLNSLLFGLNSQLNEDIDDEGRVVVKVEDDETSDEVHFVENVNGNPTLDRFFKDNHSYIQKLVRKAVELKDDPSTPLGNEDLLSKMIMVTLHQQVIYCDDSASMKRDGRWDAQAGLVKKIAQITTRILPEGDGVALRFINQNVDSSEQLSLQQIGSIVDRMSWQRNGDTPIGTNLKSRILEPLVYNKLQSKTFARPLLVSVITDGTPSQEKDEAFVEAIKECGDKLQRAGYPRDSVKFMIGQIGTARAATSFLKGVGEDRDIADMVFVTADQLDERLSSFKENEGALDRWLIETLFSPIKN